LKKNKSLREKLDTSYTFTHNGKNALWFNNINLRLGKVPFNGVNVIYYKSYGSTPSKSYGFYLNLKPRFNVSFSQYNVSKIGTMGADLFQDKILVIDYKNTRMAVSDSLPVEYENLPCVKFDLDKINRIKIPFRINGKEEWLMFDTGSSLFQLITSKEKALEISDSIVVDSLSAYAWGEPITIVQFKVNKPVEFAGKILENSIVTYSTNFYENENFWGITGNAYFWNNVVIIDYKNRTFRIK
jgi:hypothetical protein